MDNLKGWRTYLLACGIVLMYFGRIYLIDDASAATLLTGTNVAAVVGAIAALIGAGKFGDAQIEKARAS